MLGSFDRVCPRAQKGEADDAVWQKDKLNREVIYAQSLRVFCAENQYKCILTCNFAIKTENTHESRHTAK